MAAPEALVAVRDSARSPFGVPAGKHPAVLDLSAAPGIDYVGPFTGFRFGSPLTTWPVLAGMILVGVGGLLRERRRLGFHTETD